MRILRDIDNKTRKGRIRNKTHRQDLRIKSINERLIERQLRWSDTCAEYQTIDLTKIVHETKKTT